MAQAAWFRGPARAHRAAGGLCIVCKKDTLLLIDDTPINPYWLPFRNDLYNSLLTKYELCEKMPGKGMYILDEDKNADLLLHNYQVLYKFNL